MENKNIKVVSNDEMVERAIKLMGTMTNKVERILNFIEDHCCIDSDYTTFDDLNKLKILNLLLNNIISVAKIK